MDFVRSDTNDGAIAFMQLARLEEELTLVGIDVVIELVEICQGGETWAWDMADGGEEETVEGKGNEVYDEPDSAEG